MWRSLLKHLRFALFCGLILAPAPMVFAQDGATTATPVAGEANNTEGWKALAAGLCIAIAAVGGAIGQAKTAAAGLEGIARNPGATSKIFTPMLLGLALIESLVIYALIIAFILIS